MPDDYEVGRVSWLPTSKMHGEAVEEALDYLYFMQEVTNAYATELTWVLALVLGATCLYIWRALGLQEAERLHSQLASSRPVFSSSPTPTTAAPASVFVAAYKNRFAHKDKGRVEEQVSAVGVDILHSYNNPTPYRQRVVPRAVWKRHSSGQENERTCIQSLWDCETSAVGPWNSNKTSQANAAFPNVPGYRRSSSGSTIATGRSDGKDLKDIRAQHYPYSYTQSQHHHLQQQIQMQKVYQQMKQQQDLKHKQKKRALGGDSSLDDVKPLRQNVNNLPRRCRTPSPRCRPEQPVPVPRGEKPAASGKRRKESHIPQPERQSKAGKGKSHDATSSSSDSSTEKSSSLPSKKTEGEATVKKASPKRVNTTKEVSPSSKKSGDGDRQVESKSTADKRVTKASSPQTKEKAVPSTEPSESSTTTTSDSHSEKVERLKHDLVDQATDLLKTLSKPQTKEAGRRQRNIHREQEQFKASSKQWDAPEPKRSKTRLPQPTKKTSDTRVTKKRSNTTQESDLKGKVSPSEASKGTQTKNRSDTKDEPYDSAVRRAVMAEESSNAMEPSTGDADGSKKSSRSPVQIQRKASGDGELDRSVTHEAGRRLAKLRKRLEDSLQQIQNQPGFDKELAEKTRCAKLRRRREELERLTFMKEDILELETLTMNRGGDKETDAKPTANIEPTSRGPLQASGDIAATGNDGDRDSSAWQKSFRVSEIVDTCSSQAGHKLLENSITQICAKYSELAPNKEEDRSASLTLEFKSTDLRGRSARDSTSKDEKTRVRMHDKESQANERDLKAFMGRSRFSRNFEITPSDGDITPPTHRSRDYRRRSESESAHEPELLVTRSGKIINEENLDAMLERQNRRRELLRQRKRSPSLTDDSVTAKITRTDGESSKVKKQDSPKSDTASGIQQRSPRLLSDQDQISKYQRRSPKRQDNLEISESEGFKVSPKMSDGVPTLTLRSLQPVGQDDKSTEDGGAVSCQTGAEPSPLLSDADISPYVSKRSLSHLKYEEPEIQETQPKRHSTTPDQKASPDKLWSPVFDPLTAGERESPTRRRVRWRRQAERVDKQQSDGSDTQKVPPPTLPKLTRLNDLLESNALQPKICPLLDTNTQAAESESTKTESEASAEIPQTLVVVEDKSTLAPEPVSQVEPPLLSPKPPPRTSIKEKSADLSAGGETGVIKGLPDNVEICEEKSLTPSKAATVFDPKAQLEREREKAEAERAARSAKKEGMAPSKFKANVHLFEQVAAGTKPPSPESKVKANIRMFEESSGNAPSCSPERRVPSGRLSLSPSSPRNKIDFMFKALDS